MPGNVVDATTIYFAVALVTVLICVSCYKVLIRLPESSHVLAQMAQGYVSPNSLLQTEVEKGEVPVAPSIKPSSFGNVWRIVWRNQTVVFLNLFLTTLCYPGLITSIRCRQLLALRAGQWFQTLLLTVFTLSDIAGRMMTGARMGLHYGNVWICILIRVVIFPLILLCIMSASVPDTWSFLIVSAFGLLNGYCVSLGLIVLNEIPDLTDSQKKTCGRISACSVNSGLCAGSMAAALIAPYISG